MKMSFSKISLKVITATLLLGITACSNLDRTSQNMLYGGALGSGLGAATSAAYGGCVACGAAIGGTVGVVSGYAVSQDYYRY